MTTLQEAARKALACLELYDHEDLASCEARHELRTALAQQCHQNEGWKPTDAAIAALKRFEETSSDGEGYDIPKDTMQCLQEIGLVYRSHGSVFCITDFGQHVLAAAPAPQPAQEPVKFLVNGTRFKMSFFQNEDEEGNYTDGTHVMCFDGYEKVLDGRWVALVAAENDCHLQSAQPVAQPPKTCATCTHYKQGKNPLTGIYDSDCYECSEYYGSRWEAAHGITEKAREE